jgi:hypothetical protein
VAERLAVVAERAVDDLDVGAAEAADEGLVLRLGHDDVGAREQLDGAHGQQLRVTGPGAHEGDAAQHRRRLRRLGHLGDLRLRSGGLLLGGGH